ncbi:hypothetical protein NKR19_g2872 [Coniochaeta hoffmannii]|uniref:Uncharacterized protein n=1 Tax=Coniochaeta hoffmannii TaxID=91930 RepID=A0AA38RY44_9PEZI|nr:hypothetical protein NKR19_g2872 [Coniochaeta hoffmannii]
MPNHSASVGEIPKRKREGEDGSTEVRRWIPQPAPPQSASEPSIQYLIDSSAPKLELVPGECPQLIGIIKAIEAYENVLRHHESLAARLGAQMTSPRLVRALDSLFEGIVTAVDQFPNGGPAPTWTEVIAFAKANPGLFVLSSDGDGTRYCRFTIRHFQCTITENDWRLIMSGAVDRFAPIQGTREDEAAELATVEILEERLQRLILNVDTVAEKARQLKYKLGGRKAGIKSRQQVVQQSEGHPHLDGDRSSQPWAPGGIDAWAQNNICAMEPRTSPGGNTNTSI